jgi:membrane protein YdbS with pleckstrin-like domain
MMNCLACATDIPSGASFCPKCGAKVGATAPADASGQPATTLAKNTNSEPLPEQKLWDGRYSAKAMAEFLVLGVIASIGLIAAAAYYAEARLLLLVLLLPIWIAIVVQLVFLKLNTHYLLTSQRLIHQKGILMRSTNRIEVIDIDDVTFWQGIIGRLLDVGTIKITSSDRTHPVLVLKGIDEVHRIADLIDEVRRKERRKHGLHIEQI